MLVPSCVASALFLLWSQLRLQGMEGHQRATPPTKRKASQLRWDVVGSEEHHGATVPPRPAHPSIETITTPEIQERPQEGIQRCTERFTQLLPYELLELLVQYTPKGYSVVLHRIPEFRLPAPKSKH